MMTDFVHAMLFQPSLFNFDEPAYSKEICSDNEKYKVYFEIKKKHFNNYQRELNKLVLIMYKKRETKKQEYRIVFIKEKEVIVFFFNFCLKEFFRPAQKYIGTIILIIYSLIKKITIFHFVLDFGENSGLCARVKLFFIKTAKFLDNMNPGLCEILFLIFNNF